MAWVAVQGTKMRRFPPVVAWLVNITWHQAALQTMDIQVAIVYSTGQDITLAGKTTDTNMAPWSQMAD